jgi:cation diffusion facilitator CzcD-associated flavoprotein CzcO
MDMHNVDAVVVGAGFAGLYAAYSLRAQGLSVQGFETGDDVGGTWYWNRYPGARCDVESLEYSYSFSPELEQDWQWTERFATQPEILRYLQHVAERFDLRRHFRFNTRVAAAHYDDVTQRWAVTTAAGDVVSARWVVMATGCLSAARLPDLPGLSAFKGRILQTSHWPKEGVDLTGQRVGVIGTGSSGLQCIPLIAQQAARLTVFQRTPSYSAPAHNRPLTDAQQGAVKAQYPALRQTWRSSFTSCGFGDPPPVSALQATAAEREAAYQQRWDQGGFGVLFTYADIVVDAAANDTLAQFVRDRIRETVTDPVVADRLSPRYAVGTRRMCVDTDYYATYNRPNVELVDLRAEPLQAVTAEGVRIGEREVALDALVFATGFDAVTGALSRIDIRGAGGQRLTDKWAEGPRMYLGVMTAGFPNLFAITGPGSPSVLSNMVISIEQHVQFIDGLLRTARMQGTPVVDVQPAAEEDWVRHVDAIAQHTLYPQTASWYMGTNVPGKARVFLPYIGGVGPFRQHCDQVAADGYRGFVFA